MMSDEKKFRTDRFTASAEDIVIEYPDKKDEPETNKDPEEKKK